jgi:phage gp36-like protein
MPYCTQSDLEQRIGLVQLASLTNDIWQIAAPASPSCNVIAGGTLSGTYYYVITAVGTAGETVQSTEVTGTTATNKTMRLAWTAVSSAKAYKIYRSGTSGTYTTPCLLVTTMAVTYDDTGAVALTAGSPQSDAFLPNVGVVTALIAKADTKIDSLAGQVYTVPFTTVPDLIKNISIDLSCYFALQRRPINVPMPDEWQKAYDDAIQILEDISNMLVKMPTSATIASAEADMVTGNQTKIDFYNPDNEESHF